MFGELQEYFDVTPTDNLTLDDFPTLRHIVNFLAAVPQKGASPAAGAAAPAAPVAPAPTKQPLPTRPATPAPAPAPPLTSAVKPAPAPAVQYPNGAKGAAPAAPAPARRQSRPSRLPSRRRAPGRFCRFGAADRAGLGLIIESALRDSQNWDLYYHRYFTPQDHFRLAIVADSPATLAARLTLAQKQMDNAAAQTVLEQQGILLPPGAA